jgi:Mg2+ and Co2+ transporter CorA
MSANDQLWIIRDKDGLYSIYVDACVDNPFDWREHTSFKVVKTREEAEKIAYDLNAEYGTVWIDNCEDGRSEVDRLNTELRKQHQKNVELEDEILELKKIREDLLDKIGELRGGGM